MELKEKTRKRKTSSISLPPDMWRDVKKAAASADLTVSQWLRRLIRKELP